jgi:hypothetical protein
MAKTPVDLYAFGNRSGPRPPRLGVDVVPNAAGMVGPESPNLPRGMSAFGDLMQAPVNGHDYILPGGAELPTGIAVLADGVDVEPKSTHPPTHYTFYPAIRMPLNQFLAAVLNLPWRYGGRK